ncbi:MAG TPA: asparaginase domain-containing protein [Candidatus Limnocylindria bacterium]|jgi:L-asparaginase|nr:asparaginase domain-containing protein [Candidatus Limnocylindria bacterium]
MATTLHILCTGGTFDKIYGSGAGVRNFTFPEVSAVTEIVAKFHVPNVHVTYDPARAMDSLDMTEADRIFIANWCAQFPAGRCVIIHGTDTMVKTAAAIAERRLDCTVVLTGALQPTRMRDSDAEFNLGGAIIAAQTSTPGVYIVMHGQLFAWNKCQKNPVTGQFEQISPIV